jgi:hypothetical protein
VEHCGNAQLLGDDYLLLHKNDGALGTMPGLGSISRG